VTPVKQTTTDDSELWNKREVGPITTVQRNQVKNEPLPKLLVWGGIRSSTTVRPVHCSQYNSHHVTLLLLLILSMS